MGAYSSVSDTDAHLTFTQTVEEFVNLCNIALLKTSPDLS